MAKSEFSVKSTIINWRVSKFSWLDLLESEVFMFDGLQWKFTMEKEEEEEVTLFFFTLNKIKSALSVQPFTLQLFYKDRNENLRQKGKFHLNFSDCSTIKFLCRLRFVELTKTLLSDDILTIVFCLTPSDTSQDEIEREEERQTESSSAVDCVDELSLDIQCLLGDRSRSDVSLKCEDKTIPAHKLILSARSEVFAEKFRSNRQFRTQKDSGIVEISDMDPSVLDQLIQFIYSGKLSDLSMDTAPQLYAAGDNYAIESLKSGCSAFIKENLTEENACGILALSDLYSDRDLKECAVSFIAQSELLQEEDIWLQFCEDHPKLANEVFNWALRAKYVPK